MFTILLYKNRTSVGLFFTSDGMVLHVKIDLQIRGKEYVTSYRTSLVDIMSTKLHLEWVVPKEKCLELIDEKQRKVTEVNTN